MKTLIVTADDFGLTNRVNEAIAAAARDGIVTSASLMVTGGAFESAVNIARNTPRLDLGLHLNLTEGRPISRWETIRSLANSDGFLYRHPVKLVFALALRQVEPTDLEREIRSQIDKANVQGLQITHIDGHKHVHAMPAIIRMIARIAPECGIQAIRCVRETVPRLIPILRRNSRSSRQILLQYGFAKVLAASWTMSRESQSLKLAVPKRFYGITQTGFLDFGFRARSEEHTS